MAIKIGGNNVTSVIYNNNTVNIVKDQNDTIVWCRPFTYTKGTLPTGVSSLTCYRYATSEPTASTGELSNGDTIYYGDKLYWVATASTGYTVNSFSYSSNSSCLYVTGDVNGVSATGISATRITWSLTISIGNYMSSVKYKINSGSEVSISSTESLTLDYSDSVVVSGTAQSEAPYNYGSVTGTGTFTYSSPSTGNKSTTVTCSSRSVKSYTFTLTKNTGVGSISLSRSSSPYQGASTGTLLSASGSVTIYYGDVLSGSASASTGYSMNSSSYSNNGVNGNDSWSPTATRLTWSLTVKKRDYCASVSYSINGGSAVSVTSDVTLTLDYADYVDVSASAQSEAPYNYGTPVQTGRYTYSSSAQTARCSCSRSVKSYTLSISVTGGSYASSYYVNRESSPYQGAATGALSNGATIYYGDVLSGGSEAKGTRYGEWDCTSSNMAAPTGSWNGGATSSPSITVTSSCSVGAELYRRKSGSNTWEDLGWVAAGSSKTDTGLGFNTSCIYYFGRNQSRSYWTRYKSSSNFTGTTVTGNVTASFSFGENNAQTETNWLETSQTRIYTGDVASYTLTISITNSSYGSCSVTRTSSPVKGASTGELSDGATIYYGDVLEGSSAAASVGYSSWGSWGGVEYPSIWSGDGARTSQYIGLNNRDSETVNMWYSTSNSYSGATLIGSVASGSSTWPGASFSTTYYAFATKTVYRSRTKYTYSKSSSNYTGTNGVTGNVTASFDFGVSTSTEYDSTTGYSSIVSVTTNSINSYTLTISVTNGSYGSYSVTRTSSPGAGASTGALSNGATIYYGDVLSGSSSANGQSSTSWGSWSTPELPVLSQAGNAINVTNNNSSSVTRCGKTGSSYFIQQTQSANSTVAVNGSPGSTYEFWFEDVPVSRTGTYYIYSKSLSNYTGTNGVTGDVTASFQFSRTEMSTSEYSTSSTLHRTLRIQPLSEAIGYFFTRGSAIKQYPLQLTLVNNTGATITALVYECLDDDGYDYTITSTNPKTISAGSSNTFVSSKKTIPTAGTAGDGELKHYFSIEVNYGDSITSNYSDIGYYVTVSESGTTVKLKDSGMDVFRDPGT